MSVTVRVKFSCDYGWAEGEWGDPTTPAGLAPCKASVASSLAGATVETTWDLATREGWVALAGRHICPEHRELVEERRNGA